MKQLDTTSLRKNITLSITLAMLLLIIITAAATTLIQKHRQDQRAHEYTTLVHQNIESTIKHYMQDYTNRIHRMVETTELPELLKQKDREGLEQLLRPKWDLMKEGEPYLTIMHLHLPDGTSFLRLHKPELFGDQLTHIRPMLKEIHRSHQMISGYETGKYGTVYRTILPIFDAQQTYLGAFEVGLNVNFILHTIHETNGFSGLIFIKKEDLKLLGKPNDMLIDGYRLQSDLTPDLKAIYNILASANRLKDDTEITVGEKRYLTHIFTPNDFKHQATVKILFFQDISKAGILNGYMLAGVSIAIVMVLALLALFIYRLISTYQDSVRQIYRKQMEQVDASEHLLGESQRMANIGSWEHDIISGTLSWSDEIYRIFEIDPAKFTPNYDAFLDVIHPEDRKMVDLAYSDSLKNQSPYRLMHRLLMKDGRIKFVQERCETFFDTDGRALISIGSVQDVTEQKSLQDALQFSRNYLQVIFDSTPNIMITTDGERIENATPAMLEFFGYETLDDFKSEHDCICDFFLEDHELLQPVMQGVNWMEYILSRPTRVHKVHMMHNGKRHRFIVQAKPMILDKKRRSVVTFIDITELEETRERLEYAVNGSNDGLWDWNLKTNTVYFSPRWKEILGYKDDELPNLFQKWKDRIHPDDIEKALHDVEMSHRSPGILFDNIHRLRHKDGHWLWILGRGQTIFDKNGKAVRMVGFLTDISELKNLGEQLSQSRKTLLENEEKFQAIVTSTQDAIIMLDDKAQLVFWNPSAKEMLGYDEEEFAGKDFHDITAPKSFYEAYKKGYKKFSNSGEGAAIGKTLELTAVRKGGIEFPISLSLSGVQLGGRWYGIGIMRDITEQKALENELRASKQQFDLFMLHMPYFINIKDESYRSVYSNPAKDRFLNKPARGTTAIENSGEKVGQQIHALCDRAKMEGKAEEIIRYDQNGQNYILRALAFAIPQNDGKVYVGVIYIDITKQYKDQHEINKLQQVLENSPVSIVITDVDGNIEYVNPWFCQLTGYTQEETIGQNPKILQSDYRSKNEYKGIWNKISSGHVWSGIFKNLKKNGEVYWESAIIAPIKNEKGEIVNYIGIKQEITEKVRLEQELVKQEEKTHELGAILEESVNEIYIFDRYSLKFLYANKGAQKNIGYSPEELSEMTLLDIKPAMTMKKFLAHIMPLNREDVVRIFFSSYHKRKDGTIYPIDVYLQESVFEGTDAYMGIIIDTTEREKIRKELRDHEEIMIAQSRHAAMGEMIGMIAHQWRQPITVIAMGANNMLIDIELEEVKEESFKEEAKNILKQTEYLSKTIEDFRNFFRPDKSKEEVKFEEVMSEAQKIIGKTLEHANITLSIKDKNGYKVKTYSRELLQVFINLLKNAKEALIEHREKDRHIDVMISDDADSVITTVCDNGGGIDEAIIGKIFDPYFSTKDKKTGTGLGLYMSKTIIEKHMHGTIEVSNTKEGACFKIVIPLSRKRGGVNHV